MANIATFYLVKSLFYNFFCVSWFDLLVIF